MRNYIMYTALTYKDTGTLRHQEFLSEIDSSSRPRDPVGKQGREKPALKPPSSARVQRVPPPTSSFYHEVVCHNKQSEKKRNEEAFL